MAHPPTAEEFDEMAALIEMVLTALIRDGDLQGGGLQPAMQRLLALRNKRQK